jgi:mono/diheme cytochrome c family protein
MMHEVMKWTSVWVVVLLFIVLGQTIAQPLLNSTWDPLAGSRVFGTKGCSKCHAINGTGGEAGPDLAQSIDRRSFYDLAAAMWNHFPRMLEGMEQLGIRRPRLNPQETSDLIAFLYTLGYFDPPGNTEEGHRLFTEKKCVVCHQVGGIGGVVGPNLDFFEQYGSPIAIAVSMWNHGPAMVEAMRVKAIERPTFKDSELLDIIAYLKSASKAPAAGPLYVFPGRVNEGRQIFVRKRCIECHGTEGQGGLEAKQGPSLANQNLHLSLTQFAAVMWNKLPAMLEAMQLRKFSLPRLQAQEMADLVAYLYTVQYLADPGDVHAGRDLLTDQGCLECHAVSGQGGRRAHDFAQIPGLSSPTVVVSALWNHAFVMASNMKIHRRPWPRLSPKEMADLIAFLQTVGQSQ